MYAEMCGGSMQKAEEDVSELRVTGIYWCKLEWDAATTCNTYMRRSCAHV